MKEIEFSRWLFELPAKQYSQFSPSGSTFLPCLGLPSKSHRVNSISSIFLESPHQVDMKNVVKCYKHFFGYFNALKTHFRIANSLKLLFAFYRYISMKSKEPQLFFLIPVIFILQVLIVLLQTEVNTCMHRVGTIQLGIPKISAYYVTILHSTTELLTLSCLRSQAIQQQIVFRS